MKYIYYYFFRILDVACGQYIKAPVVTVAVPEDATLPCGIALCADTDVFNKREGRGRATERADAAARGEEVTPGWSAMWLPKEPESSRDMRVIHMLEHLQHTGNDMPWWFYHMLFTPAAMALTYVNYVQSQTMSFVDKSERGDSQSVLLYDMDVAGRIIGRNTAKEQMRNARKFFQGTVDGIAEAMSGLAPKKLLSEEPSDDASEISEEAAQHE